MDVGHVGFGVGARRQLEGDRLTGVEVVFQHAVDPAVHVQQKQAPTL